MNKKNDCFIFFFSIKCACVKSQHLVYKVVRKLDFLHKANFAEKTETKFIADDARVYFATAFFD